jgi:hypothetical protein
MSIPPHAAHHWRRLVEWLLVATTGAVLVADFVAF